MGLFCVPDVRLMGKRFLRNQLTFCAGVHTDYEIRFGYRLIDLAYLNIRTGLAAMQTYQFIKLMQYYSVRL